MGKGYLTRVIFHFCLFLLVSRVKDQSELRKRLFVGGQCLNRVMFCLKQIDFNDFSLKLAKYFLTV